MKNIFTKLLYEVNENRDCVLVTVIEHKGSTPREKGAQMLVSSRGIIAGTIGGGSVENNSSVIASELLKKSCSMIHEFILRKNDIEDIGMVCGGDMTVFFQYIPHDDTAWKSLAQEVLESISSGNSGYLVLNFDGSLGYISTEPANDNFHTSVALPIGERAILFGAGHCSMALCPILASVGFRPVIFDNRPEYVTPDRYPLADSLICGDYDHINDYIHIDSDDYIVIMTSGHINDYTVEKQILEGSYAYIGVIGSRKKTAAVNAKLVADGISKNKLESVCAPIGLDIKAMTPAEIAVSIAGEMILKRALIKEASDDHTSKGCPMHAPGA